MADPTLVLRDIHQPPAPPLWPPAPGWWLLLAVLALAALALAWWRRRRRRRERMIQALFDDAVAAADTLPAQVAAMSELLRRAARRRDSGADLLEGEAWLAFLDGSDDRRRSNQSRADHVRPEHGRFSRGPGRLLLEGGYRRELPADEVAALRTLARERFLTWMRRA
ncbi:DUF4381 family protein [Agrilutibacter solisilvae]|uniref:DUF4381 family protein n=1 Tax=Agrilutibacter solisilvae TaxID=2763317 RepID=A0A974Y145_9GAMM|nr:DUF4381 family protein [Lysobacter solisilvae]QSX78635.1 DUF4381 family protein [Lysobacter solisilvae]